MPAEVQKWATALGHGDGPPFKPPPPQTVEEASQCQFCLCPNMCPDKKLFQQFPTTADESCISAATNTRELVELIELVGRSFFHHMSHPGIGHDEYGIAATGGYFIKLASGFAGAGASSCSRLRGAYECRGANDVVSPMSSSCWNMQSHRFNHLLSSTSNIFEYSNIKYL